MWVFEYQITKFIQNKQSFGKHLRVIYSHSGHIHFIKAQTGIAEIAKSSQQQKFEVGLPLTAKCEFTCIPKRVEFKFI